MNKRRGIVLVFALMVMLVLSILLTSFYFQSANEGKLAMVYENSTRAFWLAEAGMAQALSTFSGPTSFSGFIDDANHAYNVQVSFLSGIYYTIVSTGTVTSPATGTTNRAISATVRTGVIDPTKFKYGIETTTDLIIKGSVDINPSGSWKEYSTLDFADLFGITKAEMKDNATHVYASDTFDGQPVDGITWVDVDDSMNIAGNLVGSGILVINGNVHFSGTVQFNGIIYVIGKLTMTGTVDIFGSVLAESSTTVDTELKGNVGINYSLSEITNALGSVQYITKEMVSWQEI
ncbi:MAG: pilus assembly PilX N-terminal domain-containing protein [Candidatus Omnitrophota bacterium]